MEQSPRSFPIRQRKPTHILSERIFTASGKWRKPIGPDFHDEDTVYVRLWGAGGSGGCPNSSSITNCQSSGGAGGGFMEFSARYSELPASVAVTVGAGGAAKTRGSNGLTQGDAGGNSSFGSYATAYGGGAGVAASLADAAAAAGGAVKVSGITLDFPAFEGSDSGDGIVGGNNDAGDAIWGAAGGGGWDTDTEGTGGDSVYAGDGGNANTPNAQDGGYPGGGGGGTYANTGSCTSGAGGDGRVEVYIVRGARPSLLSEMI